MKLLNDFWSAVPSVILTMCSCNMHGVPEMLTPYVWFLGPADSLLIHCYNLTQPLQSTGCRIRSNSTQTNLTLHDSKLLHLTPFDHAWLNWQWVTPLTPIDYHCWKALWTQSLKHGLTIVSICWFPKLRS